MSTRFRELRGIEGIINAAGLSLLACVIGYAIHSYFSLPTVAVDIDGKCQWIQYSDGIKHVGCGDSLPRKYHRIVVGGR